VSDVTYMRGNGGQLSPDQLEALKVAFNVAKNAIDNQPNLQSGGVQLYKILVADMTGPDAQLSPHFL
jgi:hypothetical protein